MGDERELKGQAGGATDELALAEPQAPQNIHEMLQSPHPGVRAEAVRRVRKWQERQRGSSPMQEAQAALFKGELRRKLELVPGTVAHAVNLFQKAIIHDLIGKDSASDAGEAIVQFVLELIFAELTGGIGKWLGKIAKKVADEEAKMAWAQGISAVPKAWGESEIADSAYKRSIAAGKQFVKAEAKARAVGEEQLIEMIITAANEGARKFVDEGRAAIDAIPVEQAATDMQLLEATKHSPAVHDAKAFDSHDEGAVENGIENQFLEAAGAPVTGGASAEALAIAMLRVYRAERLKAFPALEQAGRLQHVMKDPSPGEIRDAEKRVGLADQIYIDKRERDRASDVTRTAEEVYK